jgi:hypothetical protein
MGWFEDLVAAIQDAINSATAPLYDWMEWLSNSVGSQVGSVVGSLTGAIGDLSNQVGSALGGVRDSLLGGMDSLGSQIGSTLSGALGQVTSTLDDGLYNVGNTLNNINSGLTNTLNSGLSGVSQTLWSATNSIGSRIDSGLSSVGNLVGGLAQGIGNQIDTGLQSLGSTISGIAGEIGSGIEIGLRAIGDTISGVATQIGSAIDAGLQTLGTTISSIATQIGNALADLGPYLQSVVDAILSGKRFHEVFDPHIDRIEQELSISREEVTALVRKKLDILSRAATGKYSDLDTLMDDLADPAPIIGAIAAVVFMIVVAPAIGSIVGAAMAPLTLPIQQKILQTITPIPLSPAELAATVVQGYQDMTAAETEAELSGLNKSRFDLLFDIAGEPPGLGELLQLLNRGYMTDDEVTKAIQESRLKPKYTETVKKLRYILPPLPDIIRMGVRDAWRDDIAKKYGYDNDTPAALAENAPKLGIDPDWMKRYWRAHWELPPLSMVIDMLHRTGETGITSTDVDEFMRVQDIPTYWREKIRAVSYAPYTRVDVRRMYKTRVLTRDQVLAAYKALGYDDARAVALTDFTIKLEDETGQLNPDTLERKSYTALSNLFVRDKRSEGDLRAAMQKYGWGDQAIDLELEIARLRAEAYKKIENKDASGLTLTTVQRRIVEYTIDLYKKDLKSLGDVEAAMREFEWGEDIVTLMLRAANLEKLTVAKTSRTASLRELSIGAILEAYEAHTFNESQATERLIGIGLSADDAATEIAIKQYQIATKLRNQIVAALRDAFYNEDISETDLGIQLANYGFDANEVAGYTALWTVERSLKRKRFTEAQLSTFMKHDVITVEQYATELQKQGWSDDQIAWWLQLRGAT